MYSAYNDVAGSRRAGLAPIKPYLDDIAAAKDINDDRRPCSARSAIPRRSAASSTPTAAIPMRNIVYVTIGGMGLPDRDNYLIDNERNREMKGKYIAYLDRSC